MNTDIIGYGDIRYEFGLIRCHSESTGNSVLVVNAEGGLLDSCGYCKDDFLIVDVVTIIQKLYNSIGLDVPTVSELKSMVSEDNKTWLLYERGATCCLNQCEKTGTTQRVQVYKPRNIRELAAFIAGIRPGFKSLIGGFIKREPYTSGEPEIDSLLEDSFHYCLFQESVMRIFAWLGIPMKDSYDTIKKISKKKLKGEALKHVEDTLKEHWLNQIGNLDHFDAVYQVIKDSARYSFNCISGDTKIKKFGDRNGRYVPTVAEMYQICNDADYAKKTKHWSLHRKYRRMGYGVSFSMGADGRVYKNRILNIVKQPSATTYEIVTEAGRTIKATLNHKFPTTDGIKTLSELRVGDVLYAFGVAEKNTDSYPLTNGVFETNIPKKGQMGFQPKPNGDSVIYKSFRNWCVNNKHSCCDCGTEYNNDIRFEVHHIDFERTHNEWSNYAWLCASCHKKRHYKHGRVAVYDNGIPTIVDKIALIRECQTEDVYDIEMSGEVAHNFVIDNGLVVCNCAHALSMAYDSLYEAWFKANHTSKFYEITMNHYQEKGDKDKVAELRKEAASKMGYKTASYKFGSDNRTIVVDDETKTIYPSLTTVKYMNAKIVSQLYNMRSHKYSNFVDVLFDISKCTSLDSRQLDILIKLDYFSEFGDIDKLLEMTKVVTQILKTKQTQFQKSKIGEWNIPENLVETFSLGETKTAYKYNPEQYKLLLINWSYWLDSKLNKCPLSQRLKYQIELLGYVDYANPNLDARYVAVTGLDDTYSPKFKGVCLKNGSICELRVSKRRNPKDASVTTSFADVKFEDGDVLYMMKCIKKPKQIRVGDHFETDPSGAMNWWITNYRKATEL